jgi:hypothetical protein
MPAGKLTTWDGQFLAEVDYKIYNGSEDAWWGELTLTEYQKISDGDGYTIQLEDGRRGRCFLRKKVNRAVHGLLPLYCYHFRGNSPLKK